MASPTIPVDLRDLPPPQPLEIILDAIDKPVPESGYWAFLLPHFPQPLLVHIEARELHYRVEVADDYRGVQMLIGQHLPE